MSRGGNYRYRCDAVFSGKRKRKTLTEQQRRMLGLEKFLLRLVALAVPVYLIITLGVDMTLLQSEVARESQWLLQSMGFVSASQGTGVAVDFGGIAPFFFTITADCTGWKAMLFLVALVIAVPRRTWKARIACIAPGVAALWLVNLSRVAVVVWSYSAYGYRTAMLVHDYFWQIGLGAAALAIWAVWLVLARSRH
jgi:exosortase/archaeosortase family protein